MNDIAKKCLWLIEMLVEEEPRRPRELALSTGIDRRVIDDCLWDMMQRGVAYCRPDSFWVWATGPKRECKDSNCRLPGTHAGRCDIELFSR